MEIDEVERQTLLDMIGAVSSPIVKRVAIYLLGQYEEVTDELVSNYLSSKLDVVRMALYKLHDLEVASFRRVKAEETGWYIYYWKIHPEKTFEVLIKKLKEAQFRILQQQQYEQENIFFSCGSTNCPRKSFESAMEIDFACDVCDNVLTDFDNNTLLDILEKKRQYFEIILNGHQKYLENKKKTMKENKKL